jgi:hypothetical protein
MGSLVYATGRPEPINFADRTLAHLQIVIGSKLRLRQSLFFSWLEPVGARGGRGSIWLDAAIPLAFNYDSSERDKINRESLELLMTSANSSVGLQLVAEPVALPVAPPVVVERELVLAARAWSSAADLVSS